MGNAVILIAKQDQIVWTVFGVFWAANAVLLVAFFQSGDLPKRPVGLIVSRVGFALSPVWLLIHRRAQAWHDYCVAVMRELEEKYLHILSAIAFTRLPEKVEGRSVRGLMLACPLVSAALWE
jgi:hypothetical protein